MRIDVRRRLFSTFQVEAAGSSIDRECMAGALRLGIISIVLVFFLLMLFDTVGTLVGVAHQAGFMQDGKPPRARRALLADAIGTVQGGLLGTSTVTWWDRLG